MKSLIFGLFAAFATFSALTAADDTDIYLNQNPSGSAPYLMLNLDYRTDMTATFCNNTCETDLAGTDILEALKELKGVSSGASVTTTVTRYTIEFMIDKAKNNTMTDAEVETHVTDMLDDANGVFDPDLTLSAAEIASIQASAVGARSNINKRYAITVTVDVESGESNIVNTSSAAVNGGSYDSSLTATPTAVATTTTTGSGSTSLGKVDNISAAIAVFKVVFDKFSGIYVGMMMPNEIEGGTILRGYREFMSMDLNGDGDTDDVVSSIDEADVDTDLNGDDDKLDTGITSIDETVINVDLDGDGTISGSIDISANPITESDINGAKEELIDILSSIPTDVSGSGPFHPVAPKETHYEWYRYINGESVVYGDQTADNFEGNAGTTAPDYDSRIIDSGTNTYISPFADTNEDYSCTNFYEVYATSGNEGGNDDDDLDTEINSAMGSGVADTYETMVAHLAANDLLDADESNANAPGDQTLKSWFIQMGNAATKTDDWAEAAGTLDQYMNVGGGSADLTDVQATLEAAFIEALSVSATFVAASVPVNVFNKVEALDNFYIALFEAQGESRWPGNLKKLKLYDSTNDGEFDQVLDANDAEAFFLIDSGNDTADGRIKYEALTYWTVAASLPDADAENNEVDDRDGRAVERGGAGQIIPGFIDGTIPDDNDIDDPDTRQVLIDDGVGGATLLDLNVTDAADFVGDLGADSTTEAENLIGWMRGQDTYNEDDDAATTVRSWIMGDSIHSRPLALNYGASSDATGTQKYSVANPNIRLFMGTNYGAMHIIENSTESTNIDSVSESYNESGKELYAFYPRELMSITKTLVENSDDVDHPYGVDGEPVALVVDDNGDDIADDTDNNGTVDVGEIAYVYFGLRRGGKSYYALDVSDPWAQPTLLWHITKTSGGDFDDLGYTFSTPKVTKVKYESTDRKVLIFAGGFDTQKDNYGDADIGDDGDTSADTEGNAIYIVDAVTGSLIWKTTDGDSTGAISATQYTHQNMDHAIPSAVTVLDSNSNGITDRLYVGDLSGIVWRIDLPEGDDASCDTNDDDAGDADQRYCWSAMKLADVDDNGEGLSYPTNEDRRFFHAPDVVQTKDDDGSYDAVIIVSGDRANPLETTDENMVIMLKDRSITSGTPPVSTITDEDLEDVTDCVEAGDTGCGDGSDLDNGWKLRLVSKDEDGNDLLEGEKGLSSPIVAAGAVYVTTYTPADLSESSCEPAEGDGSLYILNLGDGTEAFEDSRGIDLGPGIPADVIAIDDDTLLIPGLGWDVDGDGTPDKVTPTGGSSMWPLYLRQIGIDNL